MVLPTVVKVYFVIVIWIVLSDFLSEVVSPYLVTYISMIILILMVPLHMFLSLGRPLVIDVMY